MSASIKEKTQKINPVREKSPQGDWSTRFAGEFSNGVKLLVASLWDTSKEELLGSLVIIFVATGSFALGRLSIDEKETKAVKLLNGSEVLDISTLKPGEVIGPQEALSESLKTAEPQHKASNEEVRVVASKNSTKYHYSYCSGAKRISEANKIYFASASAAEAAGYTLAGNCQAK